MALFCFITVAIEVAADGAAIAATAAVTTADAAELGVLEVAVAASGAALVAFIVVAVVAVDEDADAETGDAALSLPLFAPFTTITLDAVEELTDADGAVALAGFADVEEEGGADTDEVVLFVAADLVVAFSFEVLPGLT